MNHDDRLPPLTLKIWLPLDGTDPRPLEQHREGLCRWPVDTPNGTRFCCAPIAAGNPNYCRAHHALGTRIITPGERKTIRHVRALTKLEG